MTSTIARHRVVIEKSHIVAHAIDQPGVDEVTAHILAALPSSW
jgi:hypothetical protein